MDVFLDRQRALIDRALSLDPEGAGPEEKE